MSKKERKRMCLNCRHRVIRGASDFCDKGGTDIEIDTVTGMIDEAPTINEWISVKERLPQDEQWVAALLYGLVGYNTILLQYNAILNEFITDDGIEYDIDDVAYWVGLPEPPEA